MKNDFQNSGVWVQIPPASLFDYPKTTLFDLFLYFFKITFEKIVSLKCISLFVNQI